MSLENMLNVYFSLRESVFEAFGYEEGPRALPLEDRRGSYWMLPRGEGPGALYVYSPGVITRSSIDLGKNIFLGRICAVPGMDKWVYRSTAHVLVCAEPGVDFNAFLYVFDQALEETDEDLRKACEAKWGHL